MIFIDTLLIFSGATLGILIVILPLAIISYLLYQFKIKIYMRKIRKREEEYLQEQINELNDQIQNQEDFYG